MTYEVKLDTYGLLLMPLTRRICGANNPPQPHLGQGGRTDKDF